MVWVFFKSFFFNATYRFWLNHQVCCKPSCHWSTWSHQLLYVSAACLPQQGQLLTPVAPSKWLKNRWATSVSKGEPEVTELYQKHNKNKLLIKVFTMTPLKIDFHCNCTSNGSTQSQTVFKNQISNNSSNLFKATLN